MTINELIDKAHSNAKARGFWDQERNTGELLMLIVSECGEALEAHRKGKRADLPLYMDLSGKVPPGPGGTFNAPNREHERLFRDHIKDTFEDELADIVIRIADLMGRNEWKHDSEGNDVIIPKEIKDIGVNVGNELWLLVKLLSQWSDDAAPKDASNSEMRCSKAISFTYKIAHQCGVNLDRHIELKMAYNAGRERLHGKKY